MSSRCFVTSFRIFSPYRAHNHCQYQRKNAPHTNERRSSLFLFPLLTSFNRLERDILGLFVSVISRRIFRCRRIAGDRFLDRDIEPRRTVASRRTHRDLDRGRDDHLGRQHRNAVRRAIRPRNGSVDRSGDGRRPFESDEALRRVDRHRDDRLGWVLWRIYQHRRSIRSGLRLMDSDRHSRCALGPRFSHGNLDR